MTIDFHNMLRLFSCGALGNSPNPDTEYNFQSIYDLSCQQQIDTVVYLSVARLKKEYNIAIDNDLYKKWSEQFYAKYSFSVKRCCYIAELTKKLDKAGIANCMLKGDVISEIYAEPDSRVSSDVDLWIVENNCIGAAANILKEDGFSIDKCDGKSHQIECVSPQFGLIEIHTDFCDEVAKKIWFKNKVHLNNKDLIDLPYRYGGVIHSLSYTDNAIIITLHFIKHFLSHGCGCRQLMDTLLYLQHYKNYIDWKVFNNIIDELHYTKFIDICKKSGAVYFGLDFEQPSDSERALCENILSDMEKGGVFGGEEGYRKSFFYAFTGKKANNIFKKIIFFKNKCAVVIGFACRNRFNVFKIYKGLREKNIVNNYVASDVNSRLQLLKDLDLY